MKQIDNLNGSTQTPKLKKKIAEKVKIINSKIQTIKNDLYSINKAIDNKEKYLFDLMRSQTIRDSNPQERKSSMPKNEEDDIFFSQLEVIELKTNEEELNRRQKDLEDINK